MISRTPSPPESSNDPARGRSSLGAPRRDRAAPGRQPHLPPPLRDEPLRARGLSGVRGAAFSARLLLRDLPLAGPPKGGGTRRQRAALSARRGVARRKRSRPLRALPARGEERRARGGDRRGPSPGLPLHQGDPAYRREGAAPRRARRHGADRGVGSPADVRVDPPGPPASRLLRGGDPLFRAP